MGTRRRCFPTRSTRRGAPLSVILIRLEKMVDLFSSADRVIAYQKYVLLTVEMEEG